MQKRLNPFLIVGLGNPGQMYEGTRHNIGFAAIALLAERHRLVFRNKSRWQGSVAEGKIGSVDVILLKPLTFMNRSGEAVAAAIRYRKMELSHLLVIVDDVSISMGRLRVRTDSGSGGHNGLKSIEEHLQTNRFARLRIGVGEKNTEDLASYVLSQFSEDEKKLVPEILERAVQAVEIWLGQGLNRAMDYANRTRSDESPSNPSIGE